VTGRGLLLRFRPGTSRAEREAALDRVGGTLLRDYELLPGLVHVESGLSADEARAALGSGVVVRPNRRIHLACRRPEGPDDPLFPRQWSLLHRDAGPSSAGPLPLRGLDVRAPEGWDVETSSQAIVAVLDTGVNTRHVDLAENIWHNQAELLGEEGVDDDGDGRVDDVRGWNFVLEEEQIGTGEAGSSNAGDIDGHGTAVASVLGAVGNNGQGMTGLLWHCRIMALRIFWRGPDGLESDVATAIDALDYAVAHGARISCNSWGADVPACDVGDWQDLYDAIQRAQERGHIFVASAGNGVGGRGQDTDDHPFLPAAFDLANVVSVTGVDREGNLPPDFNYGLVSVDLAAPAVDVVVATASDPTDYRIAPGGTSFAAPLVAGAAALLWQAAGSDQASWPLIVGRLRDTTRELASLRGKTATGGLLDAGELLRHLTKKPPEPVAPIEAGADHPQGNGD